MKEIAHQIKVENFYKTKKKFVHDVVASFVKLLKRES